MPGLSENHSRSAYGLAWADSQGLDLERAVWALGHTGKDQVWLNRGQEATGGAIEVEASALRGPR